MHVGYIEQNVNAMLVYRRFLQIHRQKASKRLTAQDIDKITLKAYKLFPKTHATSQPTITTTDYNRDAIQSRAYRPHSSNLLMPGNFRIKPSRFVINRFKVHQPATLVCQSKCAHVMCQQRINNDQIIHHGRFAPTNTSSDKPKPLCQSSAIKVVNHS